MVLNSKISENGSHHHKCINASNSFPITIAYEMQLNIAHVKLEAADPRRHPDRRKQRVDLIQPPSSRQAKSHQMIEKSTSDRTQTSGLNQRLRVEDAMETGDGAEEEMPRANGDRRTQTRGGHL
ncbi:hypothetical protein BHE74_00037493 [Ensete ventricosum]|nr:hypothetical protein BHE74_00037493 [Ensete ventricosum]